MSDDEDYMSDKFLQLSEKYIPPSLTYKHSDKRKLELIKRKTEIESKMKERNKSIRGIETEKREEGLSSAISSTNKGFKMLMKMGYKPGEGIGKTKSGIVEPISVEVREDRQGLGKIRKEKLDNHSTAKIDGMNMSEFRSRIAQERVEQMQKVDLFKSQKICQVLDTNENIEEPDELWFWPQNKEENIDDSNDDTADITEDETLTNLEKLDNLTKYLRKKYFYCIWCGMKFNDEDDLRDNCPGNTRNDH